MAGHALCSDQLPKIVATFVSAGSQGQRTHSARTNLIGLLPRLDCLFLTCFKNMKNILRLNKKRKIYGKKRSDSINIENKFPAYRSDIVFMVSLFFYELTKLYFQIFEKNLKNPKNCLQRAGGAGSLFFLTQIFLIFFAKI